MFASTQVLVALGPSLCRPPPVVRVSETPPTDTVVVACSVVVPGVAEVITTSQVPVVPTVVQFCVVGVPGPVRIETVQLVPAGAFTGPVPGSTFTWQCSVWLVPTSFVAGDGVNVMFASTHVFVAFGPSLCNPSPVVRVNGTPPTVTVVVACRVVVPGVADVITTSQVPVVPTVLQSCVVGVPG